MAGRHNRRGYLQNLRAFQDGVPTDRYLSDSLDSLPPPRPGRPVPRWDGTSNDLVTFVNSYSDNPLDKEDEDYNARHRLIPRDLPPLRPGRPVPQWDGTSNDLVTFANSYCDNPREKLDEDPNARYISRSPPPRRRAPAPQWDKTSNYDDGADDEDEDERMGESNDNPLYELEEDEHRGPLPSSSTGQGNPNNNPLYGNDPFKPATATSTDCMTEFLRPKGRRNPQRECRKPQKFDDHGAELDHNSGRSDYEDDNSDGARSPASASSRSTSPRAQRSPRHRRGRGLGLVRGAQGDRVTIKSYPPARFSPVMPSGRPPTDHSGPSGSNPTAKRMMQTPKEEAPQFGAHSIMDLIAAVRSDQNLLIAEVRRDGAREPRIPGDHDRYFAPRKGDIIVHFAPTLDKDKLVEYFDEKLTMLRLQVGDKLVRVKYDNYKIPDHLMITSKLYIYAPEWVYLGKAVQTIKTA